MQRLNSTRGVHSVREADAVRAAKGRQAVEVSIRRLDYSGKWTRTLAAGKSIKIREIAEPVYLENRTGQIPAAIRRRAVEVPVVGLGQAGWTTVEAAGERKEIRDRSECVHLEYGAALCRAEKDAVVSLDQS